MAFSPSRLEREKGVVTGQRLKIAERHRQTRRIEKNVDQTQPIHIQIIMRAVAPNDKGVARGEFVAVLPGDVKPFATGDDDDLGELVAMQAKRLLRIATLDDDRKTVGVKPVLLLELSYHFTIKIGVLGPGNQDLSDRDDKLPGAVTIVLVRGTIVKVSAALAAYIVDILATPNRSTDTQDALNPTPRRSKIAGNIQ